MDALENPALVQEPTWPDLQPQGSSALFPEQVGEPLHHNSDVLCLRQNFKIALHAQVHAQEKQNYA